jgi:hypothetical protein
MTEKPKKRLWLEEYKTCSCSFLAVSRADLPGYCQKHGTEKRHRIKISKAAHENIELGYAGQ